MDYLQALDKEKETRPKKVVIEEKEMWVPTNIEGVDSPFGSDGRLLLLPRRQPQLVQLHQSENQRYYHNLIITIIIK